MALTWNLQPLWRCGHVRTEANTRHNGSERCLTCHRTAVLAWMREFGYARRLVVKAARRAMRVR